MPTITDQNRSVAANSTTGNVLSGQLYEFLGAPSRIRLLAAAAAVGLRCTFNVGGTVVVNDQAVSQANRFPIIPDDQVTEIGGYAGERLFLDFRNTTVGAIVVNSMVIIEPLG